MWMLESWCLSIGAFAMDLCSSCCSLQLPWFDIYSVYYRTIYVLFAPKNKLKNVRVVLLRFLWLWFDLDVTTPSEEISTGEKDTVGHSRLNSIPVSKIFLFFLEGTNDRDYRWAKRWRPDLGLMTWNSIHQGRSFTPASVDSSGASCWIRQGLHGFLQRTLYHLRLDKRLDGAAREWKHQDLKFRDADQFLLFCTPGLIGQNKLCVSTIFISGPVSNDLGLMTWNFKRLRHVLTRMDGKVGQVASVSPEVLCQMRTVP